MTNEQIAHDLALVWVNHALSGDVTPYTEGKQLVPEYLAAYDLALEKLNELK